MRKLQPGKRFSDLSESPSIRTAEWAAVLGIPIANTMLSREDDPFFFTPIGTIAAELLGFAVGAAFGHKLRGAAIGASAALAYVLLYKMRSRQIYATMKAEAIAAEAALTPEQKKQKEAANAKAVAAAKAKMKARQAAAAETLPTPAPESKAAEVESPIELEDEDESAYPDNVVYLT